MSRTTHVTLLAAVAALAACSAPEPTAARSTDRPDHSGYVVAEWAGTDTTTTAPVGP